MNKNNKDYLKEKVFDLQYCKIDSQLKKELIKGFSKGQNSYVKHYVGETYNLNIQKEILEKLNTYLLSQGCKKDEKVYLLLWW